MNGLLVGGLLHHVDGLDVTSPGPTAPPWCRLDPRDYRMRRTRWVRQIILHGTRGGWPQRILPGRGPGGRGRVVADWWRQDPQHSGAHLVVDTDGHVYCLADVAHVAAFHATVANDRSVGIEMAQIGDSELYEATLAATVVLVRALCDLLAIPFQIAADPYRDAPIERLIDGGPDVVGIYGHRDNTHRRGRGDPGDEIYRRLIAAGAEPLRFGAREDLAVWQRRQARLVQLGAELEVDGIAGPATVAALRRFGFRSGREFDAASELPIG